MKPLLHAVCYLLYYGFGQYLPASFMPFGRVSKTIRYWICSQMFKKCGTNVNIERKAFIQSGRHVSIGNNSAIGINAFLSGTVTIGNDVMMGKDVIITTSNHNFTRTDIPMNTQGLMSEEPVAIEDDVWISDRVIILPGVTVKNGSIIGAGSVVTKDVPEYAIVGGNPAKVIRMKNERNLTNER